MADGMPKANTHGGAGRGQGRKPLVAGEDSVTVTLRLSVGQKAKLDALGRAAWVRAQLERVDMAHTGVKSE